MYNKIHLAAKFMDRFTTKFCGWGTLTQEMADNWYKTDSNLEQSGHDLLDTVLANCKSKVSTKAKTKECFERIIILLHRNNLSIIIKTFQSGLRSSRILKK